mmetsp:Transcript_69870/g.193413  ORF Transcript_69870/g.193413 Transcript_69870/m.193413 type:complete len:260 (-) Transcript_69870:100-879(-)
MKQGRYPHRAPRTGQTSAALPLRSGVLAMPWVGAGIAVLAAVLVHGVLRDAGPEGHRSPGGALQSPPAEGLRVVGQAVARIRDGLLLLVVAGVRSSVAASAQDGPSLPPPSVLRVDARVSRHLGQHLVALRLRAVKDAKPRLQRHYVHLRLAILADLHYCLLRPGHLRVIEQERRRRVVNGLGAIEDASLAHVFLDPSLVPTDPARAIRPRHELRVCGLGTAGDHPVQQPLQLGLPPSQIRSRRCGRHWPLAPRALPGT